MPKFMGKSAESLLAHVMDGPAPVAMVYHPGGGALFDLGSQPDESLRVHGISAARGAMAGTAIAQRMAEGVTIDVKTGRCAGAAD
jgi:hypothetical protein